MKLNLLLAFGLIIVQFTSAQVDTSSELFQTLKKMDSIIFEQGFNQCEFSEIESIISEDLEFYHDQGGVTNSKQEFIDAIKKNICGNQKMKPIRKLVESSMEIFPLYDDKVLYGAIQLGNHEFYIKEPNKDLYITGIAKFTHLWILNNNKWVLKRVLSYDHQPKNNNSEKNIKAVSNTVIKKYIGDYIAPNTGEISIVSKDDGLEIRTKKMNLYILPQSETVFFNAEAPLTFEFISNEKGEVTKMIIKENGKLVEEALSK